MEWVSLHNGTSTTIFFALLCFALFIYFLWIDWCTLDCYNNGFLSVKWMKRERKKNDKNVIGMPEAILHTLITSKLVVICYKLGLLCRIILMTFHSFSLLLFCRLAFYNFILVAMFMCALNQRTVTKYVLLDFCTRVLVFYFIFCYSFGASCSNIHCSLFSLRLFIQLATEIFGCSVTKPKCPH